MNRSFFIRAILASAAVFAFGGCQGDPYYPSYTKRKPDPKDVVGVYAPDEPTAAIVRTRKHLELRLTQIVIRDDGTFSIDNIPEWNNAMGPASVGQLVTRSGTWTIKQPQGSFWALAILYAEGGSDHYAYIHLREQKPPYLLHFTLGDPYSGEAMVFVKQQ